jgi:hypothetical protein
MIRVRRDSPVKSRHGPTAACTIRFSCLPPKAGFRTTAGAIRLSGLLTSCGEARRTVHYYIDKNRAKLLWNMFL